MLNEIVLCCKYIDIDLRLEWKFLACPGWHFHDLGTKTSACPDLFLQWYLQYKYSVFSFHLSDLIISDRLLTLEIQNKFSEEISMFDIII